MDQLDVAEKFITNNKLRMTNEWRYPFSTTRLFGGCKPGEVARRERKTGQRKQTRAEVDMLCKYMLFRKGKFTPGKMV
jgi:hypothetical protein